MIILTVIFFFGLGILNAVSTMVDSIAGSIGVRDSDVIRFALKSTLNRLGGLCDPEIRGANLIPAIVEAGPDFIRYFDLDAVRLDAILNAGAEPARRVSHDDVALVSLAGSQPEYAMLRLNRPGANGVRSVAGRQASVDALRQHLYDKYVFRGDDGYERGRSADEDDERYEGGTDRHAVGSA